MRIKPWAVSLAGFDLEHRISWLKVAQHTACVRIKPSAVSLAGFDLEHRISRLKVAQHISVATEFSARAGLHLC